MILEGSLKFLRMTKAMTIALFFAPLFASRTFKIPLRTWRLTLRYSFYILNAPFEHSGGAFFLLEMITFEFKQKSHE